MLENRLNQFELADRYRFNKDLEFGKLRGSKIGRDSGQLLSFWGVKPVPQWSSGTGRSDTSSDTGATAHLNTQYTGNLSGTGYSIGDTVAALKTCGILKL